MKFRRKEAEQGEVTKQPVRTEDEDRIVRTAVEREDGRFTITNGQEKTLERAATRDE